MLRLYFTTGIKYFTTGSGDAPPPVVNSPAVGPYSEVQRVGVYRRIKHWLRKVFFLVPKKKYKAHKPAHQTLVPEGVLSLLALLVQKYLLYKYKSTNIVYSELLHRRQRNISTFALVNICTFVQVNFCTSVLTFEVVLNY